MEFAINLNGEHQYVDLQALANGTYKPPQPGGDTTQELQKAIRHIQAGELDDAERLFYVCLRCEIINKNRGRQAELYLMLGSLYLERGDNYHAEVALDASRSIALEYNLLSLAYECNLGLLRVAIRRDEREKAMDLLRETIEIVRQGDRRFADEADKLLQWVEARNA